MVVTICNPKTRAHFGRQQFCLIEDQATALWANWAFGHLQPDEKVFRWGPQRFQRMFDRVLDDLALVDLGFTKGCFRAGGATAYFLAGKGIDWIRFRGRWRQIQTLEAYVQEGTAAIIRSKLRPVAVQRVEKRLALFSAPPSPPQDGWSRFGI